MDYKLQQAHGVKTDFTGCQESDPEAAAIVTLLQLESRNCQLSLPCLIP